MNELVSYSIHFEVIAEYNFEQIIIPYFQSTHQAGVVVVIAKY